MSAETIARWNAIPMTRPEDSNDHPLKRPRENVGDGDESDDVSLVSRSPSPPPTLDSMDIDKYDEYHRGVEREPITVETRIKPTNKGFAMLAKLGWVEGQPLGLSGDGRVDPVPFYIKNDLTGLGKANQDVRMIESTVSQRRELDSERQNKETEGQRKAREDMIAKRAAVQNEVTATLRSFYCDLCEKQFQNVAQYDEHTNSYAHHHKARFRDMQVTQRASTNTQEDVDKRKEKERKREEKELRKLAKAAGVKLSKPLAAPKPPLTNATSTVSSGDSNPGRSGRSIASSLPAESQHPGARTPERTSLVGPSDAPPGVSQRPNRPSHNPSPITAPAFRAGGWSSLDTTTSATAPTSQNTQPPPPPASITSATPPSSFEVECPTPVPPPQPDSSPVVVSTPILASLQQGRGQGTAAAPGPERSQKPQKIAERQESARSGWQQFRSGGPSRRK